MNAETKAVSSMGESLLTPTLRKAVSLRVGLLGGGEVALQFSEAVETFVMTKEAALNFAAKIITYYAS